ncbi:hypothetical protein LUZ60_006055 [Juncus effusus]|nr:hypothetical protein LUZ60_006055 [Juncus effusus]
MKYPRMRLALLPFAIIASLILLQIVHRKDNVEFAIGERKFSIEKAPKFFLEGLNAKTRIGLVNLEENQVRKYGIKGNFTVVNFERVSENNNITWKDLFPDSVDEELVHGSQPTCPKFPLPDFSTIDELDLVIAQLPCGNRDVLRLQVHLVTANLAVEKGRRNERGDLKMIFTSLCEPMIEIFRCDDLVKKERKWWMYTVDTMRLEEKIRLPVGSCELVVPLRDEGNIKGFDLTKLKPLPHHSNQREAYVTVIAASSDKYVCGAIALAHSIRKTGTTRDLVLLHDKFPSRAQLDALQTAGWALRQIENLRNPKSPPGHYYEYTYSKLRIFQVTDYDKIVFIDADVIVLRNLDILFNFPSISVRGNHAELFNSGIMVVEPSNCTFENMMNFINIIEPYDGSDQGFLNEFFFWWHRLPARIDFMKMTVSNTTKEKLMLDSLYTADPAQLYAIHYLGIKPWLCYRDYDCNWDVEWTRKFANDEGHWRWWRVYDEIDKNLKAVCKLSTEQKNNLEMWRSEAKKKGYGDAHWKLNISDPRRNG